LRLGIVIPFSEPDPAQKTCNSLNDGASWAKFNCAAIDCCYYSSTGLPLLDKTGPVDVSNKTIINILGLDYVVPSQVSGHIFELRKAVTAAARRLEVGIALSCEADKFVSESRADNQALRQQVKDLEAALKEAQKTPAQRGDDSAARWREGCAAFNRANGLG
jgi:hypothetical protein